MTHPCHIDGCTAPVAHSVDVGAGYAHYCAEHAACVIAQAWPEGLNEALAMVAGAEDEEFAARCADALELENKAKQGGAK
jgi:hypothetical protein